MSPKTRIAIAAVAFVVTAGGVLFAFREKILSSSKPPEVVVPPPPAEPEEPGRLLGFKSWTPEKRLDVITDLMNERTLAPEVIAFIRSEICNREHRELLRNNMANALVCQHKKDPELHKLFIKMLDDESESIKWRSYALQFMAETLPFSSESQRVRDKLFDLAGTDKGQLGATAVVQIAHRIKEKQIKDDGSFEKLLAHRITEKDLPDMLTVSLLGAIAEVAAESCLEPVRGYVETRDCTVPVKKSAIQALAAIGKEEDLKRIVQFRKHHESSLAQTADAAIHALLMKITEERTTGIDFLRRKEEAYKRRLEARKREREAEARKRAQ